VARVLLNNQLINAVKDCCNHEADRLQRLSLEINAALREIHNMALNKSTLENIKWLISSIGSKKLSTAEIYSMMKKEKNQLSKFQVRYLLEICRRDGYLIATKIGSREFSYAVTQFGRNLLNVDEIKRNYEKQKEQKYMVVPLNFWEARP
jgi:hypothetical protein